jgi:hypothetical protein
VPWTRFSRSPSSIAFSGATRKLVVTILNTISATPLGSQATDETLTGYFDLKSRLRILVCLPYIKNHGLCRYINGMFAPFLNVGLVSGILLLVRQIPNLYLFE